MGSRPENRSSPYVMLLRAVNVGGHGKVAMADLRQCLTRLGYTDVRTLLQSGNVVFRSEAVTEAKVESQLADELGLRTDVMIRSAAEWARVVASNPFVDAANADPSHLVALVSKQPVSEGAVEALRAAVKKVGGREAVALRGGQVFMTYPDGIGTSRVTSAIIDRSLGTPVTGRNWNTVLKLAALCAQ